MDYKDCDSNVENIIIKNENFIDLDIAKLTPEQITYEISSRIAKFAEILESRNLDYIYKIIKQLQLLCQCQDIISVQNSHLDDFLSLIFDLVGIKSTFPYFNDIIILICEITIHSLSMISKLLYLNISALLFSILTNSFPKNVQEKCYKALAAIASSNKRNRDLIILSISPNYLFLTAQHCNDQLLFESMIDLAHSYSLFPLDQQEISSILQIIRLLFINDGMKEITLYCFETGLDTLYNVMKSPVFNINNVDYLQNVVNLFGKSSKIDETLLKINCKAIISGKTSIIDINVIADLIDLENNSNIIQSAARCIGLICFNLKEEVSQKNNIEFLEKLFDIFSKTQITAKNELGFAIVGIAMLIPEQILYDFIINNGIILQELFELSNKQVLRFLIEILEKLRNFAAFRDILKDFIDFLNDNEILSRIDEIYDRLDSNNPADKKLDEISKIFLDNINNSISF